MKVILYSTHCPRCNVLAKKLQTAGIDYEEVNDIDIMRNKGFLSTPILEVDSVIMDFTKAVEWINNK